MFKVVKISGNIIILLIVFSALTLLSGCNPKYLVTTHLETDISGTFCSLGNIRDNLPESMRAYNKPTGDEQRYFQEQLGKHLAATNIFKSIRLNNLIADYEVRCTLLGYNKSNALQEIETSALVNSSSIAVAIELFDLKSNKMVFGINVSENVSFWAEQKGKLFDYPARYFAEALLKEMRKIK